MAISQTIYRLHQLGIGSFKQLENYIDRTTLSLEKDRKELVELEKKATEISELTKLLDNFNNDKLDDKVFQSAVESLTISKGNIELEKIVQTINNKDYQQVIKDISKLKISIEGKHKNIKSFEILFENYKHYLIKDRSRLYNKRIK